MPLRCLRCNTVWPDELQELWGHTEQSDGMGPQPVCTALIEDKRAGAPMDGQGRHRTDQVAVQVCRGMLVYVSPGAAAIKDAKVKELSPIDTTRYR